MADWETYLKALPSLEVPAVAAPLASPGRGYLGLIRAMEASGDSAVSPKGAVGRFQIMPATAKQYGFDPAKLADPDYNETAAVAVLDDLHSRFGGDPEAVMIGYNAGPSVAKRWLDSGKTANIPGETDKYLARGREYLKLNPLGAVAPEVKIASAAEGNDWAKYLATVPGPEDKITAEGELPPGQESGPGRVPKMIGHALATGVQTVLGLPGALSEFTNEASGLNQLQPANKTELVLQKIQNALVPPTPSGIAKFTGLGLENHPELTPTTAGERYGSAAAIALPMTPLAMAGGVGTLPALAITEAGAMGAQAATDLTSKSNNEGLKAWAPLVGGVVGSLGAGGLTGFVGKELAKGQALKRLASAEKELEKAQDAVFYGRDPRLKAPRDTRAANDLALAQDSAFAGKYDAARAVDDLRTASQATLAATKETIAETATKAEALVAKVYDEVAAGTGGSTTLQEAGTVLQDAARNWVEKTLPKKLAEVSKPLAAAVPETTETGLTNFNGVVDALAGKAGSLESVAEAFGPNVAKQVGKRLAGRNELAELTAEEGAEALAKPTTWAEVRALRSKVGDAMKNPTLAKGISQNDLSAMYSALTADLSAAARAKGPEALKAWQTYNETATGLYNFRDNVLTRLASSKNEGLESVAPGKAVQSLLNEAKVDGTALAALRAELPKETDELAAAALREGEKTWAALAPEAKAALLPDPTRSGALDQAAAARTQLSENSTRTLAEAQRDYKEIIDAAKADARDGNWTRSKAVREAQRVRNEEKALAAEAERRAAFAKDKRTYEARKEVKSAKADLPPSEAPFAGSMKTVKSLIGGGAAAYMAPSILNALSLPAGPVAQTMLAGAGMAIPAAYRGLRSMVRNPQSAMVPATGAAVGNALAPARPTRER